ncbi:MAG TPA: DMT family transporter, partial [Casimicrobiaceae bacterium]|nr:DMT family transporter [Casimicrobiaceae bacterium]
MSVSPYILLTLASLFWSCNWIIGRALHEDVPPLAMTFFRWLFASLILLPLAWPHLSRDWSTLRRHWKALVFLGAVGIAAHNALAYVGLNYTSATNGVILNSFIPVMIIAMSWVLFNERLNAGQLAGVAISLAGVLAILTQGSLDALRALRLNKGDLFVIVSMAMWALYTVSLRRAPRTVHPLSLLLAVALIGDALLLPLWLGENALSRSMTWTLPNFAAIVSVSLFSSVLAYVFWNRGVELIGAPVAGLFVHLMPVFGVILASIFLGERFEVYHGVGIVLILAGIAITSRRGRKLSTVLPD